jgi:ribokinase
LPPPGRSGPGPDRTAGPTGADPLLLVVGSANTDLVTRASRLPTPGETVQGFSFAEGSGGKGANQAVAAARLGQRVRLAAAVGADAPGDRLVEALRAEGVDVSGVQRVSGIPTGTALIVVDQAGENMIVANPGANAALSLEGVDLSAPDALLCQLEVPVSVVAEAARRARGLFCLNASPMAPLPEPLLRRCDLVIVNESEYKAADGQLDGCRLVAVTRGAEGAVLLSRGSEVARSASPKVAAVDTAGAGDAFAGTMVAGMLHGSSPAAALARACRAGSVVATRKGAQASLPYPQEL